MEAKDVKWCPQHGYPLPCYKCGMPLNDIQQKDIYELGKQAGIKTEQKRMTKALRELHKQGWTLLDVIEAEDTMGEVDTTTSDMV